MLTGQRVEEIAWLHVEQWDAAERIIDWSKLHNLTIAFPRRHPISDRRQEQSFRS